MLLLISYLVASALSRQRRRYCNISASRPNAGASSIQHTWNRLPGDTQSILLGKVSAFLTTVASGTKKQGFFSGLPKPCSHITLPSQGRRKPPPSRLPLSRRQRHAKPGPRARTTSRHWLHPCPPTRGNPDSTTRHHGSLEAAFCLAFFYLRPPVFSFETGLATCSGCRRRRGLGKFISCDCELEYGVSMEKKASGLSHRSSATNAPPV